MKISMIILSWILLTLFSQSLIAKSSENVDRISQQSLSYTQALSKTTSQQNNHTIWFHSISSHLFQDLDDDGFFQTLNLVFDLDTLYSRDNVYIELWLRDQSGNTQLLFESEEFYIYDDLSSDTQELNIQLLDLWYSGFYQLSIQVFDAGSHIKLLEATHHEYEALHDLPLEARQFDRDPEIQVLAADIFMKHDHDRDGYYQQFELELDLIASHDSERIQAEIFLNNKHILTSESFLITANSGFPENFDIELLSGFAPGYYDLEVRLINMDSRYRYSPIKADVWLALHDLKLESAEFDSNQGTTSKDVSVRVTQSGGNLSVILIMMTLLLVINRKDKVKIRFQN